MADPPAYQAGVRPGDLVTGLGADPIRSSQDLVTRVAALQPGSQVELKGLHGRRAYTVKLKVLERPIRATEPG